METPHPNNGSPTLKTVAMGINAQMLGVVPEGSVVLLVAVAPLTQRSDGSPVPDLGRVSLVVSEMDKRAVSLLEAAVEHWAETTRKAITAGRLVMP